MYVCVCVEGVRDYPSLTDTDLHLISTAKATWWNWKEMNTKRYDKRVETCCDHHLGELAADHARRSQHCLLIVFGKLGSPFFLPSIAHLYCLFPLLDI